jgi:adenine-specific DNA-methyltransferase
LNMQEDMQHPAEYADEIGREYVRNVKDQYRKLHGQYFTPIDVARFMASLLGDFASQPTVRILDPGAGTGVLACALGEHLAALHRPPQEIDLTAYEIDESIIPLLRRSLDHLGDWLGERGIRFSYQIRTDDFVLANAKALRSTVEPTYDFVITNPPYFKVRKDDPRAQAVLQIVYGQPNIYAFFMALSAALLNPGGKLISITPRSFSTGSYFKAFRRWFFRVVRPTWIHLFGSRKEAFDRDSVLQENVVMVSQKDEDWDIWYPVSVSYSNGVTDLENITSIDVGISDILQKDDTNRVLSIPVTGRETKVVKLVRSWKGNLHSYGLEVSTGPVVPFRAQEHLLWSPTEESAPLIWMQHVGSMDIRWPITGLEKCQYIDISESSLALLLPKKNYVVMRRFSSKEESRRLVSAPILAREIDCKWIGIENHLNYIHRPNGELTENEAYGIAALFNSRILDTYFRTSNGNTQVSAEELRNMPLPPIEIIREFGRQLIAKRVQSDEIDDWLQSQETMGGTGTYG